MHHTNEQLTAAWNEAGAKVDLWHAEEMRNRQDVESMRPVRDDGTVAQAQRLG